MSREIMQMALDALINGKRVRYGYGGTKLQEPLENSAIKALEAELAKPEQEWIDLMDKGSKVKISPVKQWVGLTKEEVDRIVEANTNDNEGYDIWCNGEGVAINVEGRLKEKNHG
jgi:hypothetical protein